MRAMKDSGIKWIGKIPEDWNVVKLKYLLSEKEDNLRVGPFGSVLSNKDFVTTGKWVYNQRTVIDDNFKSNDTFITEEKYEALKAFSIHSGDMLITTRGTIGKIAIVPLNAHKGILHPCIIKFKLNTDMFLPELMKIIFNETDYAESQFMYMSNSTTIEVIYSYSLKNIFLPLIPMEKQKKILSFLKRTCFNIDSIIFEEKEIVNKLKKYKKVLITEKITKGLNQNVEMKNSGIEWIGEIPKDWYLKPIKYIATFHNGDRGDKYPSKEEFQSSGIPFIKAGHLIENGIDMNNMDYISEIKYRSMSGVKLRKNDILYCLRGSVGKNAILDIQKGTVASSLVAIRSISINPKYLYYFLNSDIESIQRGLSDNGTAQPNLSVDDLGSFKVCIAPMDEQQAIVSYLDNKCNKIDAAIAKKKALIERFTEYKRSLIYEVITGKKEIL